MSKQKKRVQKFGITFTVIINAIFSKIAIICKEKSNKFHTFAKSTLKTKRYLSICNWAVEWVTLCFHCFENIPSLIFTVAISQLKQYS